MREGDYMLKILICDDDAKVTQKISSLINHIKANNKIDFNIDIRESGSFALSEKSIYDIAIVDIEMPGINGLGLSEILKRNNPDTIVIVLTSFSNYLDSAMKIQVFRYLSKPIDADRFIRNFLEAIKYYRQISKQIIIEKNDEVHTVKTKDILYIENKKHGSVIATKYNILNTNKKPIEWYNIINQPNCFVFSHKSYIVNLQNVINFSRSSIVFEDIEKNTVEIPCISQRKYSEFKKAFYDFAGGIK